MTVTEEQGKTDPMLDHTHKIHVEQPSLIIDITICYPSSNLPFGEVDE